LFIGVQSHVLSEEAAVFSQDDSGDMLINPAYAVSISPDLAGKHEAIVPKQRWIEANTRLIDEIGSEEWLRRLLAVLEGDYVVPSPPDHRST
jgi:hypothetical protein